MLSDVGYRYRRNDFYIADGWDFGEKDVLFFYDYAYYNVDTFEVDQETGGQVI